MSTYWMTRLSEKEKEDLIAKRQNIIAIPNASDNVIDTYEVLNSRPFRIGFLHGPEFEPVFLPIKKMTREPEEIIIHV